MQDIAADREILDYSLLDLVVRMEPSTTFRRALLESDFMTETTLGELIRDPEACLWQFRMQCGVGGKALTDMSRIIRAALFAIDGADWAQREGATLRGQLRHARRIWDMQPRQSPKAEITALNRRPTAAPRDDDAAAALPDPAARSRSGDRSAG